MNYSELLSNYIESSGLSIGEIARRMNDEKGVKIDRSYISMLKNGKTKNPASEEVNQALAEVTGGDPEKLILAAYLEKAPDSVKNFLEGVEDKHVALTELLNSVLKVISEADIDFVKKVVKDQNPDVSDEILEEAISNSTLKFTGLSKFMKFIEESLDRGGLFNINDFLNVYKPVSHEKNPKVIEITPYQPIEMHRLPVLGSIRAGEPIDRIEYNEGYTLVDPDLLRGKEGFALRVKGDSMSGDRILDGDIVIVAKQPEVLPHEIAVVAIDGETATLKRVKIHGDMVMLTPSNPAHEPQLVPAKDVHIIGKVVEVKFWPK